MNESLKQKEQSDDDGLKENIRLDSIDVTSIEIEAKNNKQLKFEGDKEMVQSGEKADNLIDELYVSEDQIDELFKGEIPDDSFGSEFKKVDLELFNEESFDEQFSKLFTDHPEYLVDINSQQLNDFVKENQNPLYIEDEVQGKKFCTKQDLIDIATNSKLREYITYLKKHTGYKFKINNVLGIKNFMNQYPKQIFDGLSEYKKEILKNASTLQNINFVLNSENIYKDKFKLISKIKDNLSDKEKTDVFLRNGRQIQITEKTIKGGSTYNSFNEYEKIDYIVLNKILMLSNNLKDQGFRNQIGNIIQRDLQDKTTEFAGLLIQEKTQINIKEIDPVDEKRGSDNSPAASDNPEMVNNRHLAIFDFHMHAILEDNTNKSPSSSDLGIGRLMQSDGIVFTSNGANKFLVHINDYNGNVVCLGEYSYS